MKSFKNFLSEYIEDKASIIDVCSETTISFEDNDNFIFENSVDYSKNNVNSKIIEKM